MIKEEIRQRLVHAINALAKDNALPNISSSLVSSSSIARAKDKNHGDFASNIALILSKSAKIKPHDIAAMIKDSLEADSFFTKIDIAGPGFINFTLASSALATIIPEIATKGEHYGRFMPSIKKRALIEFVSANPTGGLHLGHARGAFVGDALARLLEAAGFDVVREYYVNDTGNQVETLARTIHKRYQELFGATITIEKGEYPGEYVKDIAQALKNLHGDRFFNKPESDWLDFLIRFGVDYNLALIRRSLATAGIHIDNWYYEHSLHESGKLKALLKKYDERNMLYEADAALGMEAKVRREESKASLFSHMQEGGTFLKTSQFGDDEDRIIRRRDGRFVYLTADLAYHDDKFARGFDLLVNVFGGDHAGHVGRIKAGMAALGHDINKLHFVIVQIMRLIKHGKEVRFSKRAGEVFGLDDLIHEIGADVARFVFLMRSTNAQFDLNLDEVTKQSNDNPIFYVQYGHARMATILSKALKDYGLSVQAKSFSEQDQAKLSLFEEKDLILRMAEFPDVVLEAAHSLEPHRLIFYCQELIKTFHSYFTKYRHSEKIISDDKEKTKARLAMVYAMKLTIFNALSFLGLSAPDHMEQSADSDDG